MKISGILITYNEERNIERCLESIRDIVDEIVVLDSGSTDNTEIICKKYNVRFYTQPFRNFIQQKNDAIALASYDFIFSIDADEVASPELKESIIALKADEDSQGKAYMLNRLTNYCGKWIQHCGWYPDYVLRLFDRKQGCFQGKYIHEKVIVNESLPVETLRGDLFHYSYRSISEHVIRANRYTDLTALEAFEKGKKAPLFKIWFNPKFKFFRDYIIKAGFLDGYYGYIICKISAFATFLKYSKLRELYKQNKHE